MRAQEITLSNGLKVVYLHHPAVTTINMQLDVAAGAMHDPEGKVGLAHALEHCVLMQTENLRDNDLQIELKKIGGDVNAFTSESKTAFPLKARAENDNFTTLADILRQIVAEPCFDDTRIQQELKVIDNEYHDDLDNENRELLIKSMNAQKRQTVFSGRILGTPKDFMALAPSDFMNFIHQHYRAQTMRLYIVAPYELKNVEDILEGTLGQIPEGGRIFSIPENIYGESVDTRIQNDTKHQNQYRLFFTLPTPQDSKSLVIARSARDIIGETLVWGLRHQTGCTYNSEFQGMDLTSKEMLVSLKITTRPHQTNDFIASLLRYASEIDNIPNPEIQATIDNAIHALNSYNQALDFDCSGLIFCDQTRGETMDLYQEKRDVQEISHQDIREKMKEILSSLSGIYATGPQPELLPSLEILQTQLKKAAGFDQEKEPTPQTILPYQPRM